MLSLQMVLSEPWQTYFVHRADFYSRLRLPKYYYLYNYPVLEIDQERSGKIRRHSAEGMFGFLKGRGINSNEI